MAPPPKVSPSGAKRGAERQDSPNGRRRDVFVARPAGVPSLRFIGVSSQESFAYHLARETWPFALVDSERIDLGAGTGAVSRARDAIASFDGRLEQKLRDDAQLLVSELVTNAVRHGHAGNELDRVVMYFALSAERLRVEVCDGGPGFDPSELRVPSGLGGKGIVFVEKLASRWGVSIDDGTCVWFELDRSP
jgi:anti-sigma regulatory factor (Ser/Thr protein kinase)